jgi:hypothetical protein
MFLDSVWSFSITCWILAGILTLLKTVEEIQERLQAQKETQAFNRKHNTQAFNRKPVGQRI